MAKPFRIKKSKGQDRWYIYVTFKGRRVRMVAGNTKAEALRYQREWENRLERNKGASIRTKKIPFSFLCDEYLKYAESNLAPRTVRERRIAIKTHRSPSSAAMRGIFPGWR